MVESHCDPLTVIDRTLFVTLPIVVVLEDDVEVTDVVATIVVVTDEVENRVVVIEVVVTIVVVTDVTAVEVEPQTAVVCGLSPRLTDVPLIYTVIVCVSPLLKKSGA